MIEDTQVNPIPLRNTPEWDKWAMKKLFELGYDAPYVKIHIIPYLQWKQKELKKEKEYQHYKNDPKVVRR